MYKYHEELKFMTPREKSNKYGVKKLSDKELISIMLGNDLSDNKKEHIAYKAMLVLDKCENENIVPELKKIKGIGEAKANIIYAALEYARRRYNTTNIRISYPTDLLPMIRHYVSRDQEYFIAAYLNGAHEVIETRVLTIGILNRTLIHPREVFSRACVVNAASIVIAHNHPSGNLNPSSEDLEVTKRLVDVGETLGIKILDHIIFSQSDYYSFVENVKI